MKTKITLVLVLLFALNFGFAQDTSEKDVATLSLFDQYVKSKNMEAAYAPFMELRARNPKYSRAIYTNGEKILKYKIKNSTGSEKVAFINDLLKLWKERATHFSSKTPKGEFAAKACQLKYNNRKALNLANDALYECFDSAYQLDKATFKTPKSLYTYFSLMVDLYDAKKKSAKELFNNYDDVVEKIENEVKNYSKKLNKLIEKEDSGATLLKKEKQRKKSYKSYLKAYDQISGSIDQKLGGRANCENLIPLYQKDFEANKSNAVWLKRAVSRMYHKECTGDLLYEKLVKAYDDTAPSADTKYFVGTVLFKNGKANEAITYFKESFSLETETFKKAKLANRIGLILKKKGRYGQAKNFFSKALRLNPSNGRPHLAIASMYAASANKCGDTSFNKRAVYWLAADEAKKASRVDQTQKKRAKQSIANYLAKAPSKSEVFSSSMAGKTIQIGCWINTSVTVPSI